MHTKLPAVLNILLADDDQDDRFFFEDALGMLAAKHKLKTVTDGERLMAYLLNSSTILPDIIFLDLNMPCKNGAECLIQIKEDNRLKKIPIIINSTSLQSAMADLLYKNGAHYYLHKGYFSELPSSIQEVIDLLRADLGQPQREKFIINLQGSFAQTPN